MEHLKHNMEKIISDFKKLLEERQEKLKRLPQRGLATLREEDEIQEDFKNDDRREMYHELRKSIVGDKSKEDQFMELQKSIFNSQTE